MENKLKDFESFLNESEEQILEIQAGSVLVRAKAAERLLGKVAQMLQEHQHNETKLLKGYTLAANLGDAWTDLLNEITKHIASNNRVGESEKIEESSYSGNIVDGESKEALWHVVEAFRKDGAHAHIDAVYKDGNGSEYMIDDMWIADNGKLMGHAKDGGAMDLGAANFSKPVAFGRRESK